MPPFALFLSVVLVFRNQSEHFASVLSEVSETVGRLVSDYEIVVIDNASDDGSVALLKTFTAEDGLANLQVYALTKEVDEDTATWVGLENALGDFVAVIDPLADDIGFLAEMLEKAVCGADVVFARNQQKAPQSPFYSAAFSVFNGVYKRLKGVHLDHEAPHYRVLSRRVVNFLLLHPQPSMIYRHLPATGGFARANLSYSTAPKSVAPKKLITSIERGSRMLISTTRAPMRMVTAVSLFGAIANLMYSCYVVLVVLLKDDVAPGWVSLSLQQSGMFFLISLVLLVLGEYILQMASLSNAGPAYYIGQELTSARITRREKLNIVDITGDERRFMTRRAG